VQTGRQKPPIRIFIAIELPPEVKELLTELQAELKTYTKGPLRWIKPELMHLTLCFIGNIEEQQIPALADAVEQAICVFKGLKVSTNRIGGFPSLKTPKLIYLGLGDSCQLTALSDRINAVIDTKLGANKSPERNGKYHPHLTLCRVGRQGTVKGLDALGSSLSATERITFEVSEITLFKSELGGKSPVYTALRRFSLE